MTRRKPLHTPRRETTSIPHRKGEGARRYRALLEARASEGCPRYQTLLEWRKAGVR